MTASSPVRYLSHEREELPLGRLPELPVLALVSDRDAEATVLRAARRMAAASNVGVAVLRAYTLSKSPSDIVRAFMQVNRVSALVADWPADGDELQSMLRCVVARKVQAVIIRENRSQDLQRVLIPTGGGIHTLQQLWVAREFAAELGIEMQTLHVAHDEPSPRTDSGDPEQRVRNGLRRSQIQARIAGLTGPVQFHKAGDVVSGIQACLRPSDLLVLGAPNYWRVAEHFRGSIPEALSRRVDQSLVMLVAGQSRRTSLREVLWNRTVCLDLQPRDKEDAVRLLIERLAAHGQIPRDAQTRLLDLAMSREAAGSTAVGCETAFPHITIPGLPAVIGCLGICPDGVRFGGDEDSPTRFVFLLITPREFYDEYLGILARIAQLMLLPAVRSSLLACRTADDVIRVLDLEDAAPHTAAGPGNGDSSGGE
ncbi:MAG: PTS transporter subunit EIIA [Phycisphaerae bacterium]|nr:PTS transporter subunit EIIA [Phycisphaerae bacterium]